VTSPSQLSKEVIIASTHYNERTAMKTADYILPYGREYSKWNPMDPTSHCFGRDYMAGMIAVVLKRIDQPRKAAATRVIVGAGSEVYNDWKIGNVWRIRHDQTGAALGTYEVVGEVTYARNEDGDAAVRDAIGVTDMKLSVACFK
jgi:hypothetical protein